MQDLPSAKKQGEELADEWVLPADSINNANLQGRGRGGRGTATVKAPSQQILITADYLRGEVGKATESNGRKIKKMVSPK